MTNRKTGFGDAGRRDFNKALWPFGIEAIRTHIPKGCCYRLRIAPDDANEFNVIVTTNRDLTDEEKELIAVAYYQTTPFVLPSDITFTVFDGGICD